MTLRVLVTLIVLTVAIPTTAVTIKVDSFIDEVDAAPGDGACESTPSSVCTLRAAIMEANADAAEDTILLPAGLFTLTIAGIGEDAAASGDLDILASVTITGTGVDTTIIDAAGIDRVFEVMVADATIEDLTIRNGSAIVADNFVGGGVLHHGTDLWLTRVRLTGNQANAGGALRVTLGATANIKESTIDSNSLIPPTFTNSTGAAIFSNGGVYMSETTITGNTNASGTADVVYLENCDSGAVINNSTIAENGGGGVSGYNCDLTVKHATIAGNAGNGLGFGIYPGLTYTLDVANSIFADNSGSDCFLHSGTLLLVSSLDTDDTCGLSLTKGDLPATDPVLLPLRDWGGSTATMYPKPGESPVIDAAAAAPACMKLDQRLYPRNNDGDGDGLVGCDMGAVEAGDLILWSGFEAGDFAEWSSSVP